MKFKNENLNTNFEGNNASVAVSDTVNGNSFNLGMFYLKTFLFFALGLFITAIFSVLFSYIFYNVLYTKFDGDTSLWIALGTIMVCYIGCYVTSIFAVKDKEKEGKRRIIPFILFSVFLGILCSSLVLWVNDIYTLGFCFLITALIFSLTGLIGYFAKGKKWVTAVSIIVLILLGVGLSLIFTFILIPIIHKEFTQNMLYILLAIQLIFLVVVSLYTVIDFYRLKKQAENSTITTGLAVYYALVLETDFINILVYVVRIVAMFSKKK